MDLEFYEFCKARYQEDSEYAIAYAILQNGLGVSTKLGRKEDRDRGAATLRKRPSGLEIDSKILVEDFLIERNNYEFCLLDLWVKALGEKVDDYNLTHAKMMGRIVDRIPGVFAIGPRQTDYEKQKCFRYKRPAIPSNDLGI